LCLPQEFALSRPQNGETEADRQIAGSVNIAAGDPSPTRKRGVIGSNRNATAIFNVVNRPARCFLRSSTTLEDCRTRGTPPLRVALGSPAAISYPEKCSYPETWLLGPL
jgi:hypothetical protein